MTRPINPGLEPGMTNHEWQSTRPDRQRWCQSCRRVWRPAWDGHSFWPTWCPYCALAEEHGPECDVVRAVLMVNPPLGSAP